MSTRRPATGVTPMKKRLIVAITGATGAVYGIGILKLGLRLFDVSLHLSDQRRHLLFGLIDPRPGLLAPGAEQGVRPHHRPRRPLMEWRLWGQWQCA